jgi:hypothetical protein
MSGDAPENGDDGEETDASGGSDSTRSVSTVVLENDQVFDALAHARRRFLLRELASADTLALEDLARRIAAWENDVPEETVREDERRSVFLALFHVHVPKLADDAIVAFDEDGQTVALADRGADALDVMAAADGALGAEKRCLNGP